ncbi:MAG: hypothetical protein IIA14_15700, partial [SAR324 cluster bacterium]|nr:hypothetical protein [SAR324 cluster bacterium]
MIRRSVLLTVLLLGFVASSRTLPALELCSEEANNLMRKAGIAEAQLTRLCELAAQRGAPLRLSLRRTESDLGYCRVTLALENRSSAYLNQMSFTSAGGIFEIFRFQNILPGTVGYASATSRNLLGCEVVKREGLRLRWPASLRVD